MKNQVWVAAFFMVACGGEGDVASTPTPDHGATAAPTGTPLFDTSEPLHLVTGGEVFGEWCGNVRVTGDVDIPAGEQLELCAGTVVDFDAGVALNVDGTLKALGSEEAPVVLSSTGRWGGLRIGGRLEANGLVVEHTTLCIDAEATSEVQASYSRFSDCSTGNRLRNGGNFYRADFVGGSTLYVLGGMLHMTDSTIDLEHPTASPDCTKFSGGGMSLDHVRFTGCHCPLHLDATTETVTVTGSIFDGASIAMMISRTEGATFYGNHFEGAGYDIQDIGGASASIQAHIAGNYFSGKAPDIQTSDMSQFTGADQWEAEPIEGVGPR